MTHSCPACECQECHTKDIRLEGDWLVCVKCGHRVYVPDEEESDE